MFVEPILTKRQFIKLWLGGGLGNRVPAWRTRDEAMASNESLFTIRFVDIGGPTRYDVPRELFPREVRALVAQGYDESRLYYNGTVDNSKLLLQGEYVSLDGEQYLYGSARPGIYMREAMREASTWMGLMALEYLRTLMTPSSFADFRALEALYPEHTIELGIYSRRVGYLPGRNTLIWEVRKY